MEEIEKGTAVPMLISIIIPYYNREQFIEKTLLTVLAQTYRPLELVLVDNNSTDGSANICRTFADSHKSPDFSIILTEENEKGATAARNKGFSLAQGEWVYFFDSDDEMSPNYISDLSRIIKNGNVDMVCNRTLMIMPNGTQKIRYSRYSESAGLHIISAMLSTQSMAFSKKWLAGIGGWDERLACWNDWELGTRALLSKPRVAWLKGTVYHRILRHAKSISGNSYSHRKHSILDAIEKVKSDITAYGMKKEMWALALKTSFTAGRLGYEGDAYGERILLDEAYNIVRDSSLHLKRLRIFAIKALDIYTKCGGRGAWALAILIY